MTKIKLEGTILVKLYLPAQAVDLMDKHIEEIMRQTALPWTRERFLAELIYDFQIADVEGPLRGPANCIRRKRPDAEGAA